MKELTIKIPLSTPLLQIRLLYMDAYKTDPITKSPSSGTTLSWIHREKYMEDKFPKEEMEIASIPYKKDLPKHLKEFANGLIDFHPKWDLLVVAPSSKNHAHAFSMAAQSAHVDATVITFTKVNVARATHGISIERLDAILDYNPKCELSRFYKVLLVDDVFSTGTTAAAMLLQLQEAGLNSEADINVAVPLYIPQFSK